MPKNRYSKIIEKIFSKYYQGGMTKFVFDRADAEKAAKQLKIELPKNIGDIFYSFRYRNPLPKTIAKTASDGLSWIIRPAGKSKYQFCLAKHFSLEPMEHLAEIKIAEATPSIVEHNSLSDEQALLAKVRYNRLIDVFSGVVCYSLQNHLRTTVKDMGQVETDEMYVGVNTNGQQYVFPVQAKGGKDKLSIVQIEQDYAMCKEKFPTLTVVPIAVQFMEGNLIAMFSFVEEGSEMKISDEKHYRLVPADQISEKDLKGYK